MSHIWKIKEILPVCSVLTPRNINGAQYVFGDSFHNTRQSQKLLKGFNVARIIDSLTIRNKVRMTFQINYLTSS